MGTVVCGTVGVIALIPATIVASGPVAVVGLTTCVVGVVVETVHTIYPDKQKS